MAFTNTYLEWADFKDLTNVSALSTILEPAYNLLSQRAELLLDSYVGRQEKYDPDQTRVFPRSEDIDTSGNSVIPEQVQMAMVRIVEAIYKDGETKSPDQNSMKGEKIGDYSYNRDSSASQNNGLDLIPPEAKNLLQDFRRRSVQISPPKAGLIPGDGQLNSRQKFLKYGSN